jgi:nitrogen fixation protein NifU and related proteins
MDSTFLYVIPWPSILTAAALIFLVIGGWTWFMSRSDPQRGTIDSPDASAFLKGKCGDSMKISLRFHRDRVVEAKYWTDGCRMSSSCGAAAAKLALDRTPEEIADIDHVAIEDEVGGLPEEESHCATLAAGTLQEALRLYLLGGREASPEVGSLRRSKLDDTRHNDSTSTG